MEKTEMIKERSKLLKEIWALPEMTESACLAIFQEVCKDDRMAKIHAAKGKHVWEGQDGNYHTDKDLRKDEPATEKQVNTMIKLHIPSGKYTKHEASVLISEKIEKIKKKQDSGPSTNEGW